MTNDDSQSESSDTPSKPTEELATNPQREVLESYGISEITELDKLNLPLLIVAKSRGEFESSAAFLSRRNWPTTIATTLPEAIQCLVAEQPKFVLVSANHPNPKIAKLPQIVAQAFNTKCIGFCEKNDGPSMGLLNRMHVVHRIFGQLSGPNIHRQIKKIVRDEYDAAKTERAKDSAGARSDDDGNIRVAGNNKGGDDTVNVAGGATPKGPTLIKGQKVDAASLLKMLDDGQDENQAESASATGSAGRSFKVVQPKSTKPTSGEDQEEQGNPGTKFSEVQTGPSANRFNEVEERPSGKPLSARTGAPASEGYAGTTTDSNKESKPATLGAGFGGDAADVEAGNGVRGVSAKSGEPSSATEGTQHSGARADAAQASRGAADRRPTDGAGEVEIEIEGLTRAIKKALREVCRESNHQVRYLIRANAVGVIPYRSGRQRGYITVAWADPGYKGRETFLEALKFSLMDFLPIEGVSADLEVEFLTEMGDVNYLKLAKAKAKNLVVQEHEGLEVGVAFFPTRDRGAREKVSVDQMVHIRIDDLSPEDPVTFKAYLKMELNKKYVLYLSEGRKILQGQQERLKKSKVPGLHIEEGDFERFVKYLHEVEVRNLVRKFAQDGESKKSA